MFIVLSPAKTLDYETRLPICRPTQPRMLDDSAQLVERAAQLSESDIASLMNVSEKIAVLNQQRFADWQRPFNKQNARPAVFTFNGDVYKGLDAWHFSTGDLILAQQRLRILSGLYGVLRPLDLIQPYRLEMGVKLDNPRGKNLYEFWGDLITGQIEKDMEAVKTDVLINLASNEYFKSVHKKQLPGTVIEPVFEDEKNGQYKIISFWAKTARGRMAAWIIKNNVTSPDSLKNYSQEGYKYAPNVSTGVRPVFRRASQ